jgi:hypothetical protein
MERFDINRVHWERNKFQPWYLKEKSYTLEELRLPPEEELIIIDLSGQSIGFLQREVVYHHIIQGQVNSVNFILTFCGVCNAGVLLNPELDGTLFHFRETGVYNGQQIFEDIETHSLWNHLTGECLHGQHKGKTLSFLGSLYMSSSEEAKRKFSSLPIYISGRNKIFRSIMRFVIKHILGKNKNWLPPHFAKTLPAVDARIPKMTMGLAVKVSKAIRFYPIEKIRTGEIKDMLDNELIFVNMDSNIPRAITVNGKMPFSIIHTVVRIYFNVSRWRIIRKILYKINSNSSTDKTILLHHDNQVFLPIALVYF